MNVKKLKYVVVKVHHEDNKLNTLCKTVIIYYTRPYKSVERNFSSLSFMDYVHIKTMCKTTAIYYT